MGNRQTSGLSDQEVHELCEQTHFNASEIREMYDKFRKDFPEGVISRESFYDIYVRLFPDGDAETFADYVFNAYDVDGNGVIDFDEFANTVSIAARGSLKEKLKWAFNLYDLDGDGRVTRAEAAEIIMAIYQLRGISNAGDEAERSATQLFSVLDKNQDDGLTEDEFVCAIQRSPAVKQLFQGRP